MAGRPISIGYGLLLIQVRPDFRFAVAVTDTIAGADYDLVECDLGDLDPHAVSSALKAYLRERKWRFGHILSSGNLSSCRQCHNLF